MKSKLKELILKYPGYVQVIIGLDSNNINLLYAMNCESAKEFLDELLNKSKDKKEEKEQVLYYSNL